MISKLIGHLFFLNTNRNSFLMWLIIKYFWLHSSKAQRVANLISFKGKDCLPLTLSSSPNKWLKSILYWQHIVKNFKLFNIFI